MSDALVPDLDLELAAPRSIQEMLDDVPLHVVVADEINIDGQVDPSLTEYGKRRCIAVRSAGGRCTVTAMHSHILCCVHSGTLDPSAGGLALAKKRREARISAEDRVRFAQLGTRGVIAETFRQHAEKVQATVLHLLSAAATGDLAAAKLIGPYLNQGLGMPTETVAHVEPTGVGELAALPTSDLASLLERKRAERAARQGLEEVATSTSPLEADG